ncbi:hypothetical protein FVE85_6546 [Porphyridium purpureum]|uniref:C2 domain-containing protein n=1 Tax=Porphyridium purpureum TaxID=35688 RepID=A0A5J4Z511_PORPP|nr:hypothetical protein FVE85_6546 [Porphyridium purpureum]|eukprot:POR4320..scf295_1
MAKRMLVVEQAELHLENLPLPLYSLTVSPLAGLVCRVQMGAHVSGSVNGAEDSASDLDKNEKSPGEDEGGSADDLACVLALSGRDIVETTADRPSSVSGIELHVTEPTRRTAMPKWNETFEVVREWQDRIPVFVALACAILTRSLPRFVEICTMQVTVGDLVAAAATRKPFQLPNNVGSLRVFIVDDFVSAQASTDLGQLVLGRRNRYWICYNHVVKRGIVQVYRTFRVELNSKNVMETFGSTRQHWNTEYEAAQRIYSKTPEGLLARSMLRTAHLRYYNQSRVRTEIGSFGDGAQIFSVVAEHTMYTYVITDSQRPDDARIKIGTSRHAEGEFFLVFSETGASFMQDMRSKHAPHANAQEQVVYSGEVFFMRCGEDEHGKLRMVFDNNSGTFAPDAGLLPKLRLLLEKTFCGGSSQRGLVEFVTLDRQSEQLLELKKQAGIL